jgi:hypothetical protein
MTAEPPYLPAMGTQPRRPLPRTLLSMLLAAIVVAACGSSGPSASPATSATPTLRPSSAPTAGPTGAATVGPTGPFDGQAYALDLPDGWTTFDLKDPAGAAALDAFVAANPEMAGAIEAFKSLPNVTMAVNPLVGNVVVSLSLPTGGLPLESIAASFTAQFSAVPGITSVPEAEMITLPVGPAAHWALTIQANDPGGGTSTVAESIYLVANDTTAVLVEFVDSAGTGVPQEQQIIQTLRFTP